MVIIEPTAPNNSVRPVVRIILGSVAQSVSQSVVIQSQAELAVVGNSWDFHETRSRYCSVTERLNRRGGGCAARGATGEQKR